MFNVSFSFPFCLQLKATGTRLGTLLESTFGLLLAFIIAMIYSWALTLVILGFLPIMVIAGALRTKALTGHAVGYKKALENAGKVRH